MAEDRDATTSSRPSYLSEHRNTHHSCVSVLMCKRYRSSCSVLLIGKSNTNTSNVETQVELWLGIILRPQPLVTASSHTASER